VSKSNKGFIKNNLFLPYQTLKSTHTLNVTALVSQNYRVCHEFRKKQEDYSWVDFDYF